jgi:hypothetical protein
VNLKEKNYLYANSTTQKYPKEIMSKDFSHLPPVSVTPEGTSSCDYLRKFVKKFETSLMVTIRGLGETDPCRKTEVENLVALSQEVLQ